MAPEPDPDVAQEAIEYCYEQGWSDGLPLVPASRELVDRFLATTSRAPEEVLWRMDHLGRECTVETAAINAAMAGCRPEYFPVVLAAWDAVMSDRAAKGGGWQSTSGPAPMIIINGPIRQELGINCTGGIFAAGFRPNATIPRAIGLMIRNAFGLEPHVFDQTTQGIPGRFSICFGENEEESPWEPLAVEKGLKAGGNAVSCTLTRTYEFVDNRHTQDAEHVLWDIADTIARTGVMIFTGQSVAVVLGPEHAQMFAAAGMSKDDVKDWLIAHTGRSERDLRRAGKDAVNGARGASPVQRVPPDTFSHFLAGRDDVMIVVAGARNAAMSMVVRVFGQWSNRSVAIERARSPVGSAEGG